MLGCGITDKGIVRQQNQDAYDLRFSDEGRTAICVVCDGMGGARAGNVASQIAGGNFMTEVSAAMEGAAAAPDTPEREEKAALLERAVATANEAVFDMATSDVEYQGMGTTLVGGIFSETAGVIVNVGDSRAYHISAEGIRRITRDHSVVEDMVDRGDLTEEEARAHPSKNLITRALGTEKRVVCDIFEVDLQKGDYILLCSDGLSNIVEDEELLQEVRQGREPAACCRELLNTALSRGAPDNVTVVLLKI